MSAINATIIAVLLCFIYAKEACAEEQIVFWHGLESPENIRILEEKLKAFHENTGIFVILEYYGAADRVQNKIISAVEHNRTPDVMWWGPMNTALMAETGKLAKVEDFIRADHSFQMGEIFQGLWDGSSYKGEIWTFPFSANNVALYYNKDHFKEAGLNPAALTDWDDLREYARALTTKERKGLELSYGSGEWLTFSTLLPFLWQAGGEFLSPEGTEIMFNSSAGAEALAYLVDLVEKEKCAKWSKPGLGYQIDSFIQGRVSMMICGPWQAGALQIQDKVNYGAIALPANKRKATCLGGENLYLFKSGPEKEAAAWQLCKFIASPDFQVDWAISSGYLPISRSAISHRRYKDFLKKNEFIKVFSDQMPYARARPSVPGYNRLSNEFSKAAMKVFCNKLPAGIALECASRKAQMHLQ